MIVLGEVTDNEGSDDTEPDRVTDSVTVRGYVCEWGREGWVSGGHEGGIPEELPGREDGKDELFIGTFDGGGSAPIGSDREPVLRAPVPGDGRGICGGDIWG